MHKRGRISQSHTATHFPSKEDIQRAVAADGRSSGGSESDGSDSDSSSDSSSFVKQQKPDSEAEDTKEGKRKGPKAKCQPAPKRRRSVKGPPDRPEKDERIAQSLASHGKTADLIVELKPADIWRSVVRAAEVDRRMSKVAAAQEDLLKLRASDKMSEMEQKQADDLDAKMKQSSDFVLAMKEVARIVRSKPLEELVKDVKEGLELLPHLGKCAGPLLSDIPTISDIVHCLAKKLFEADWLEFLFVWHVLAQPVGTINISS